MFLALKNVISFAIIEVLGVRVPHMDGSLLCI
jgi:hypothetical protein